MHIGGATAQIVLQQVEGCARQWHAPARCMQIQSLEWPDVHRRMWCRAVRGNAHHAAQVLANEVRVLSDGFRDGAEDDALLRQLCLEGSGNALRIEDIVISHVFHACQALLLVDGNPQFAEGFQQLGVHLIQAFLQHTGRKSLSGSILMINSFFGLGASDLA